MTKARERQPIPEPEVINPRYAGATPEMVARALLRRRPEEQPGDKGSGESAEPADGDFQQGI